MFLAVSGGDWFLPLLIFLIILGFAQDRAKKKNNTKVVKTINIITCVVFVALLMVYWIWYFEEPDKMSFFNVAFLTIVMIYPVIDQLLKHFKKRLKPIYRQLRIAVISIYILLIMAMILFGSHFSVTGWIIAVIVAFIFAVVAFMGESYDN